MGLKLLRGYDAHLKASRVAPWAQRALVDLVDQRALVDLSGRLAPAAL